MSRNKTALKKGITLNLEEASSKTSGKLSGVITILDSKGKPFYRLISPLMIKFHPKDVLQVMVGASILAIPVGFTEETWKLAEIMPLPNILGFLGISLAFIASFVYYNYYRGIIKENWNEFAKRVASTYLISFLVVALILTLIQRAPWGSDLALALKRIVLVAFPASMSAAVADSIK